MMTSWQGGIMTTSFFGFLLILTYAHKPVAQFQPRIPNNARKNWQMMGLEPTSFLKNRFLEGNFKENSPAMGVPNKPKRELRGSFYMHPSTALTPGGKRFVKALVPSGSDYEQFLGQVAEKCGLFVMFRLVNVLEYDLPYEFIQWIVVPSISRSRFAIVEIKRGRLPAAYIIFSAEKVELLGSNVDVKKEILGELYYQMATCFMNDGPPYLMTGMPRYFQYIARYTPANWKGLRAIAATSNWDDGEDGTVVFLLYCQHRKSSIDFVKELNARMKEGDADDTHYVELLGLSAKDLWEDFKDTVREL